MATDYENVGLILAPEDQTKKKNSVKIDEHFSLFRSVIFLLICAMGQHVMDMFAVYSNTLQHYLGM